jgi:putative ABC transport system ATP-binding protein
MRLIGPRVIRLRDVAHGRVTRLGSAIRLEGISQWYGAGRTRVQALCEVTLDIPAGGYVALTGPSGAGKSTLLSLVGGLERPQSGRLDVGDRDLARLDGNRLAAYRRDTVGFVFQHFGLLDLLSARENIELAEALSAIPVQERRRHADDLLEEVGLTDRAHHRPGQLSGGERQRVAIARALVNDPSLILADEPTGNLDAGSAMRILDLLESIHAERGCTLVIVTHNEAVATRAERRYRMDAGRVLP